MSIGAEVRIKLGIDDAMAHAAIAKASAGFGMLHKQAMAAASGFGRAIGGFAKNMLMAAGIGVAAGGLSSVIGAAVDATKAAEAQKRGIASALAMTDQTGASYDQLKAKAGGMRAEFVEMGMKAGVMASSVVEIFSDLAERSGKSTEAVKKLTQQVLDAGRVTGDTEMLTRGMRMLEMGMVGARNPIVALIRTTGVLKGSIHEVAAAMGKMKPEQQMAAGEEAISRLAAKAKGMAPTFGMLSNQMKQMKENILEDIGGPLMKGIIPSLMEVQKWIQSHRKEIEHVAQTIGQKVGEWVKSAAKMIGEAFKYLETHAKEIQDAISMAANMLKEAVAFLISHKEIIAGMLTVKGLSSVSGAAGQVGGAALAGVGIGTAITGFLDKHSSYLAQRISVWDSATLNVKTTLAAMEEAAKRGDAERLEEWKGTLFRNASLNDEQMKAAREAYNAFKAQVEAVRPSAGGVQDIATKINLAFARALHEKDNAVASASQEKVASHQDAAAKAMEDVNAGGALLAGAYNQARATTSDAAMQEAIGILRSSDVARRALIESGVQVSGGIEALAAQIGGSAGKALLTLSADFKKEHAKSGFQQSFSGGQTFNITQDLRKSSPDDIALVTRKDVFKRAMARGFAKTAILGGG